MIDLKTINQGPTVFTEKNYCLGTPPIRTHANFVKHSPLQDDDSLAEIHDGIFTRLTFNGPQLYVRNGDVASV